MAKNEYINERKSVSRLIYLVLTEKLLVREALLKFPRDVHDPSIKAAYHALIHYEADIEIRQRDIDYKDEQNEYLEFIAQTLENGNKLPQNIIDSYDKYYKDKNASISSKGFRNFLLSISKFLNV